MNTVLLDKNQDSFLTIDEVSLYLPPTLQTAWEVTNTTVTDSTRENALITLTNSICALNWQGDKILGDNQIWPIPTTKTNESIYVTGGSDSTITSVTISTLTIPQMLGIVGGSIINIDEYSEGYLEAAKITDYDLESKTLTLDSGNLSGTLYGLTVSPANLNLLIVWPMPTILKRAFALQAYLIFDKKDEPGLQNLAHKGRTSTTGDPGTTGTVINVGGKVTWDFQAYNLIKSYLRNTSFAVI